LPEIKGSKSHFLLGHDLKTAWKNAFSAFTWCISVLQLCGHYLYLLALEWPPKAPMLKTQSQPIAFLGSGRMFRRWGLVERSEVMGRVPLKGILAPVVFSPCFLGIMRWTSSHQNVLPQHRSKITGQSDHALQPWVKISLSSLKLFS
jgi:hypothetical protein